MSEQEARGPWPGAAYNGFAHGEARWPPPPRAAEPPPPARRRPWLVWGGVAAALAAGLALGVSTRPQLNMSGRTAAMKPAAGSLPVRVAEAPSPAPAASGRLEVLSPELKAAADTQPPVVVAPPPPAPVETPPASMAAPVPPPAIVQVPPPAAPILRPPPPVTAARPSYACADAHSRAEAMVCSDEGLARLDRRLQHAYERAIGSGAPYRQLRDDQQDWLAIREDAARRSPDAVASVYRQRIRELEEIADGY